jgi:hypothetical protein
MNARNACSRGAAALVAAVLAAAIALPAHAEWLKRVKAANGMLALCAVQAPVLEILDITGFTGMLDVHSGRAEAMAALA